VAARRDLPPGAVNQPPPPRRLLKARAREAGASDAAIEDLDDAADPKVRAHAAAHGPGRLCRRESSEAAGSGPWSRQAR
jgi:hypothetical protein